MPKVTKKQRELIEVRNQADAVTHTVNKDLEEFRSRLSEDQIAKIESAIKAVESARAETDQDAISRAISDLFAATAPINDLRNQSTTGTATNAPPGDDNVVDAEFTEKK